VCAGGAWLGGARQLCVAGAATAHLLRHASLRTAHTHTHTGTHQPTHTHQHTHFDTHTSTHTHRHTHTSTHTHTRARTHAGGRRARVQRG
jgi:hypothetical protein